ncbi:DUF3846 domain-containing protein [Spirosoma linguale]|uniref:DUF3846 domain-containing protein n=1 Tax=Spirosoma linguale (strain ATCC 33905 / DSM 74 / LMG 10896 / Claus 1) TaxID=504472 RepID=D2QVM3_SPILD|nr:hypothetical protein Slin_6909 [Spirosoma linguale DSM 74]
MSKLIKAISIDPTKRTIEEVEIEANHLSALYKHIGCRTIDFVCRMPNGDALIVDDEALLTDPQPPAFKFAYFLHCIHGIALVVGSNSNGRTIEPKLTLQQVRNLTKFLGEIRTEPFMNVVSWE